MAPRPRRAPRAAPRGREHHHRRAPETDPYCELTRNGAPQDSPGIGWYPEIVRPDTAIGPARATVCEGEHWDGQDTVNGQAADDVETNCTANWIDFASWTTTFAFAQCADPGRRSPFVLFDPVGARVSAVADVARLNSAASYSYLRATGVAGIGLFVGACSPVASPANEPGHVDGARPCQTGGMGIGHVTVGVYAIDDTLFGWNLIAVLVSSLDPGPGFVTDGDCSQAVYAQHQASLSQGGPPICGRDNTAITLEILA